MSVLNSLNLEVTAFTERALIVKNQSRLYTGNCSMSVAEKKKRSRDPESTDCIPGGH